MSVHSLALAARRASGWVLVAVGVGFLIGTFLMESRHGTLAFDFRLGPLDAASRLVHGRPLYGSDSVYVYPPFYAELVLPFVLVPAGVACWIAAVGCALIIVGGLWLLGVRDALVFGLALCSAPVIHGCEVANASVLVFGLIALAWRAPLLGVPAAAALKFIVWPLFVWEAALRGLRIAAVTALIALGLVLSSWALVGFEGLRSYPSFLSAIGTSQDKLGYALSSAFAGGRWVAGALTVAALVCCWRRVRAGDVAGGLAYAIGAMLTATAYVYDNYFTAVLVPLALRRPRFSAAWLAPLVLWVNGGASSLSLLEKAIGWAVFGGLIVWLGEGAPRFGLGQRPWRAARPAGSPNPG